MSTGSRVALLAALFSNSSRELEGLGNVSWLGMARVGGFGFGPTGGRGLFPRKAVIGILFRAAFVDPNGRPRRGVESGARLRLLVTSIHSGSMEGLGISALGRMGSVMG